MPLPHESMVTVRLFSAPGILSDGTQLSGPAVQRHRLALLALLAKAPHHRLARDKLVALLWPESDQDHARNLLNQAVHALRRTLGEAALASAADDLRLEPSAVSIDVLEFEQAVRAGEAERACALYAGPFLDGFHLPGAIEFERSLEQERAGLARTYVSALEAVALEREGRGEHAKAVDWWRRAATYEPHNSRIALRLMHALAAAGDRAGAVHSAQVHSELLRNDLGVEVDPAVEELAKWLKRADAGAESIATSPLPTLRLGGPMVSRFTRSWGRVLTGLGLGLLVVVGGAFLLLRPGLERPANARPAYNRTAIAVLPFQNLSTEGPYAYFAGGLHDEILTQLTKVAALRPISRTSVMGYAGTTTSVRQIAEELQVGAVVEASVQVMGRRLRVNVQLIDAVTDAPLWADRYDRTLDDAFAIQSDIAQKIVSAVGATLTGDERQAVSARPTTNSEAYLLYLRGQDYATRQTWSREDLEIQQQLYQRALTLDPNFSLAHAALAVVHGETYNSRRDPSSARLARQLQEARAALLISPDLPEAHSAMASYFYVRRDFRAALEEFAIAVAGQPHNAEFWAGTGYVHQRLGNWDQVVAAFKEVTQLDPRAPMAFYVLAGYTYDLLHQYPEAVRGYDHALGLAPDLHGAAVSKGRAYARWQGQTDTLRAILGRLPGELELFAGGTVAAQRAQLLLWERQLDSLLELLRTTNATVFDAYHFYLPSSLYAAWAHQLQGGLPAARAAFDSARVLLDSVVRELPDDWRVHAARGLAAAGWGRREAARREARWLEKSFSYREDAMDGPELAEYRAKILAQAGDAEPALDEIERLLAGPSLLSVHTLRLDPLWDPIRDHPRFRAMVARYSAP